MDDEILAALRAQQLVAMEKALRAKVDGMPERTPRERIEKNLAAQVTTAQVAIATDQGQGAAEDFARRIREAFGAFFTDWSDVETPQKAWKAFIRLVDAVGAESIDDAFSKEKGTRAHIYYKACTFLQHAFNDVLGVELKNQTPEEKVFDRLYGQPGDTAH